MLELRSTVLLPILAMLFTAALVGGASPAVGIPTPVQAKGPANVIPNPGFEVGGCTSVPDIVPGSIICDWFSWELPMSRSKNSHSGKASLEVSCFRGGQAGCPYAAAGASTEHARCTSIGSGTHPASFWYSGSADDWVWMDAKLFQSPNCAGAGEATGVIYQRAIGDGLWHEVSGNLVAPAGTESAYFYVGASADCAYCWMSENFDDLYIASDSVAGSMASKPADATQTGARFPALLH
jgi:hypothetical protein